jgi:hypothetical protein
VKEKKTTHEKKKKSWKHQQFLGWVCWCLAHKRIKILFLFLSFSRVDEGRERRNQKDINKEKKLLVRARFFFSFLFLFSSFRWPMSPFLLLWWCVRALGYTNYVFLSGGVDVVWEKEKNKIKIRRGGFPVCPSPSGKCTRRFSRLVSRLECTSAHDIVSI